MSITMKLDTNSLRALIAENPEVKLEIARSVSNNIKDDMFESQVREKLDLALLGMCEVDRAVGYYAGGIKSIKIKDPKLAELMGKIISDVVRDIATTSLNNVLSNMIEQERRNITNEVRKIVRDTLSDVVTPELAREIVLAKLGQSL